MATKKAKKPAITEVPDFNGTPTHIGDKVVYISKGCHSSELAFGVVEGFSTSFGREGIIVEDLFGFKDRPTSQSFYKIGDNDTSKVNPTITKALCEATCG